jgi:hypothetical protein
MRMSIRAGRQDCDNAQLSCDVSTKLSQRELTAVRLTPVPTLAETPIGMSADALSCPIEFQ